MAPRYLVAMVCLCSSTVGTLSPVAFRNAARAERRCRIPCRVGASCHARITCLGILRDRALQVATQCGWATAGVFFNAWDLAALIDVDAPDGCSEACERDAQCQARRAD